MRVAIPINTYTPPVPKFLILLRELKPAMEWSYIGLYGAEWIDFDAVNFILRAIGTLEGVGPENRDFFGF